MKFKIAGFLTTIALTVAFCASATAQYQGWKPPFKVGDVVENAQFDGGCPTFDNILEVRQRIIARKSAADIRAQYHCESFPPHTQVRIVDMLVGNIMRVEPANEPGIDLLFTEELGWTKMAVRTSFPRVGKNEIYASYRKKLLAWGATPIPLSADDKDSGDGMDDFPEATAAATGLSPGAATWKDKDGRSFKVGLYGDDHRVGDVKYDK